MAFDFDNAEQEGQADLVSPELEVLALAPSGGGKSSLMGTFGVKTLYLYGNGEAHGPAAARVFGGPNIVPVNWDYKGSTKLTAGQAYERLLEALTDLAQIKSKGFGAIVVDGLTELEQLVRGTKRWENLCLTDKGKHNNFAEKDATLACVRPVLDALRTAKRSLGIHYGVTCTLDVKSLSDTGEIVESQPRLTGYGVAEGLLQQFRDIVVVGPMVKADVIAHRLQFLAGVSKTSKDASGNVKKTINFRPRVTGVAAEKLPATLAADLSVLAKFKRENVK